MPLSVEFILLLNKVEDFRVVKYLMERDKHSVFFIVAGSWRNQETLQQHCWPDCRKSGVCEGLRYQHGDQCERLRCEHGDQCERLRCEHRECWERLFCQYGQCCDKFNSFQCFLRLSLFFSKFDKRIVHEQQKISHFDQNILVDHVPYIDHFPAYSLVQISVQKIG